MTNQQTQSFTFGVTATVQIDGTATVEATSMEEARAMVERMDPACFDWDQHREDYQDLAIDEQAQDEEDDDEDGDE